MSDRTASAAADAEGRKLFLGGLPFEVTEDIIRRDFEKYGDLESVHVPFDSAGRHKGFGFLTFRDSQDAVDAAREHHCKEYRGREISARVVQPDGSRGGPPGGGGGGGGDRMMGRPGDWDCPRCGAM